MDDFHECRLPLLPDNVQRMILKLAEEEHEDPAAVESATPEARTGSHVDECGELRGLLQQGFLVSDDLLGFSKDFLKEVRVECEESLKDGSWQGRLGGSSSKWVNSKVRGDEIKWLNAQEEEGADRCKLAAVMKGMEAFRGSLKQLGYAVDGKMSFQLACYPGKGSFYRRHTDCSDSCRSRVITAICYLNPAWDAQAGGQLCLYPDGSSSNGIDSCKMIAPILGRIVLFPSSLEHEVLPAYEFRYALTAWFNRKNEPPVSSQSYSGEANMSPVIGAAGAGKIFVSIASYRDPECQWTMANLFKNADDPDLIHVGVVWQYEAGTDENFVRLAGDQVWMSHVREIRLPCHEANGPCKARSMAESLWNGEEYWLQIDAHMRFVQGWDTRLKQMLVAAEGQSMFGKAVISSYPPEYESEGPAAAVCAQQLPMFLCAERFDEQGMLRIIGRRLAKPYSKPVPGLFWAAGLSFSRSTLFREVCYINLPHLFFGEEICMLARMWTAGWDIFAPNDIVVFHKWSRKNRSTIWGDGFVDKEVRSKSQDLVKMFLEGRSKQLQSCPLSSNRYQYQMRRTIQAFWKHCGIDFTRKLLLERSIWGGFKQDDFLTDCAPVPEID